MNPFKNYVFVCHNKSICATFFKNSKLVSTSAAKFVDRSVLAVILSYRQVFKVAIVLVFLQKVLVVLVFVLNFIQSSLVSCVVRKRKLKCI
jgi:hypothetical protein